ncbi:MAG: zinc ribbon domain-containing protein [Clostridiales bacterium]|nr:zinc ribbon domain-containing protein [Clostridiales bacterium]
MFCTQCGNKMEEKHKFCVECGAAKHAAPPPVKPAEPPKSAVHPLIGHWETIATTEPEAATLLKDGICCISKFAADGTGMFYYADKIVAAGGQGSIYGQYPFDWMPAGDGHYTFSMEVEGKRKDASVEFKINDVILTTVALGHSATDRKLPDDFCIILIEEEEKEKGGGSGVGNFIGGFVRGFLEG